MVDKCLEEAIALPSKISVRFYIVGIDPRVMIPAACSRGRSPDAAPRGSPEEEHYDTVRSQLSSSWDWVAGQYF